MKILKECKILKNSIKQNLEIGNFEHAKKLLDEYETSFSYDFELFSIKSFYYFNIGCTDEALYIIKEGLKINEYDEELLLNYAIINLSKNIYSEALLTLLRLITFSTNKEFKSIASNLFEENKIYLTNDDIKYINENIKLYISDPLDYLKLDDKCVVGNLVDKTYFSGIFDNYSTLRSGFFIEDIDKSFSKEPFTLFLSDIVKINTKTNTITEIVEKNYILPLISNKTLNYQFKINNKDFFKVLLKNRVYFFNAKKDDYIEIPSYENLYIGEKIYKNSKPKLLLNIFIDGLSQKFIDDYGIKNLMPCTYNFFKEGTIFNNCYVSGDWTLVSLASMFTGKYTHNHKVFHPNKPSYSLYNHKTYPEILKTYGFFNSKIDGDWRSNPNYGYLKGLDRYIYCFGRFRMGANETVMNAIEHMETFKDTDHSLWVCLSDLHDVADEYEQFSSIQTSMNILDQEIKFSNETSVQKKYSPQKCNIYKHAIKRLDTYISVLLNYVSSNYDEKDYVVNLISDHGQGYLGKESFPFFHEYRTKVPFMTRGNGSRKCVSDELVQGLDIFQVCTNLFNNSYTKTTDSNLPKTLGGKNERDYVFTESIHPEYSYKACFADKKIKVFFETENPVTHDGKVDISSLSVMVTDKNDISLDSSNYTNLINFYKNELFDKIKHLLII